MERVEIIKTNITETIRQLAIRLLSIPVLILGCLIISFAFIVPARTIAQPEPGRYKYVVVPEQVIKQVVRRILINSFKPRNKSTTVYLARQGIRPSETLKNNPTIYDLEKEIIQSSWLPKIKNIKFVLLWDFELQDYPSKEQPQKDLKYYFFSSPGLPADKSGNTFGSKYQIHLGYGFRCNASIKNWNFRISNNQKVRLWRNGGGGLGCGG